MNNIANATTAARNPPRENVNMTVKVLSTPAKPASILIPGSAFNGTPRVTFQESSAICYEKLRHELETQTEPMNASAMTLTAEDIEQYRPRRRTATKRP